MQRGTAPAGTPPANTVQSPLHVIKLDGFIDIARYPEFRDLFERIPHGAVLVDLSDAEGVDSIFLSELLLFKRRHVGRVAVLIPEHGLLWRVFEIAGIGRRLDVFTQRKDALRALDQPDWQAIS